MIDISTYPILSDCMTTLKDTSIDDRDGGEAVYMTESTRPAVKFDKVKEEYVKSLRLSEVPKSNDALMSDAKGVSRLAREEYVCFGVKLFENYCFKKVHTYTEKEFEEYLTAL